MVRRVISLRLSYLFLKTLVATSFSSQSIHHLVRRASTGTMQTCRGITGPVSPLTSLVTFTRRTYPRERYLQASARSEYLDPVRERAQRSCRAGSRCSWQLIRGGYRQRQYLQIYSPRSAKHFCQRLKPYSGDRRVRKRQHDRFR